MAKSLFSLPCLAVGFAIAVLGATSTNARAVAIDASYRGFYLDNGFHTDGFDGYLTGWDGNEYRSFFVFEIPLLSEPALAGSLRLWMPPGSFFSTLPSEPLTLWSISTAVPDLIASHDVDSPEGEAIFADLGSGDVFGTAIVSNPGIAGTYLHITLNENALAAIHAAQETQFAIGASFSSVNVGGDPSIGFLNTATGDGDNTGPTAAQLSLVPEPGTAMLFVLAVCGLVLVRRRLSPRH
ncbi:MAG: PEP-CTERM sorting domain-containing protein [Terrimicrobiaceae bacterium]|nr:PEP-CTERM sorting domain-containing protein [Terrimicrobiaceae bacterium]